MAHTLALVALVDRVRVTSTLAKKMNEIKSTSWRRLEVTLRKRGFIRRTHLCRVESGKAQLAPSLGCDGRTSQNLASPLFERIDGSLRLPLRHGDPVGTPPQPASPSRCTPPGRPNGYLC